MMHIVSVDEEKGLQLENRGETVLRTLLRILIKKKKAMISDYYPFLYYHFSTLHLPKPFLPIFIRSLQRIGNITLKLVLQSAFQFFVDDIIGFRNLQKFPPLIAASSVISYCVQDSSSAGSITTIIKIQNRNRLSSHKSQ